MLRSKRKKQARASLKKPTQGGPTGVVDYEALAQFRHWLRKFLSFSEAVTHKAGLTPQHYQTLLAIKGSFGSEPASVGDLAELLLVRHHTAVELVDRMAKLGLLSRKVDDDDSRRVLVGLTRKGEARLQALAKLHFEQLRSASPALTGILQEFRRSRSR
jgi:DNA-binding MarR family transcriptional regulator